MNEVFSRVDQKHVEVIHNAQKLDVDDDRPLSSVFGYCGSKTLTVTDIKGIAQTQTNQNNTSSLDNNSNMNSPIFNTTNNKNNLSANNTISNYNTNPLGGIGTVANTTFLGAKPLQPQQDALQNRTQNRNAPQLSNFIAKNPYIPKYYRAHLGEDRSNRKGLLMTTYRHPPKLYNTTSNTNQPITQSQSINGTVNMIRPASTSSNQHQVIPSNQNINSANQTPPHSTIKPGESTTLTQSIVVPKVIMRKIQNYNPNASATPSQNAPAQVPTLTEKHNEHFFYGQYDPRELLVPTQHQISYNSVNPTAPNVQSSVMPVKVSAKPPVVPIQQSINYIKPYTL